METDSVHMQEVSEPSTGLLDLPDELYGLIYKHIACADSRRAFRQAHSRLRGSDAITHLLNLWSEARSNLAPPVSTTDLSPFAAALPEFAIPKRLVLRADPDVERPTLAALLAQQDTDTLNRLSSVRHLQLEGFFLTDDCFTCLCCWFPKLRDGAMRPQVGSSLGFVVCGLDAGALEKCMMLQLSRLSIVQCSVSVDLVHGDELSRILSLATSLEHLEIELLHCEEVFDVSLLSTLSLKVLKLSNLKPVNVDKLLGALQTLEILAIELEHMPPQEHLMSRTVKQLHVPMVVVGETRPVSKEQFPALEVFAVGGIDFQVPEDVMDDDERLLQHYHEVQRTVSWLSQLPIKCMPLRRPVKVLDPAAFYIDGLVLCYPDYAAVFLNALSDIKEAISGVKSLFADLACDWESLGALGELFSSMEELTLFGDQMQLGESTLACVKKMPHLKKLTSNMVANGAQDHDEINEALREARDTRGHFELCILLEEDAAEEACAALMCIAQQWTDMTIGNGIKVTLTTRGTVEVATQERLVI